MSPELEGWLYYIGKWGKKMSTIEFVFFFFLEFVLIKKSESKN